MKSWTDTFRSNVSVKAFRIELIWPNKVTKYAYPNWIPTFSPNQSENECMYVKMKPLKSVQTSNIFISSILLGSSLILPIHLFGFVLACFDPCRQRWCGYVFFSPRSQIEWTNPSERNAYANNTTVPFLGAVCTEHNYRVTTMNCTWIWVNSLRFRPLGPSIF